MNLIKNNTSLIWLGLTLSIILAIGILLPINGEDYWWYLRLGQDIRQTGHIPTVDTYSYTQAGQPIVYHSWLSAVILWELHQIGGVALTVLARAILLALCYGCVWYSCRLATAGPRLASIITFLAAMSTSNNWTMRPQTFSYPLFGLMLLWLWSRQLQPSRGLWLLPLLMVAWVNLHGAFILGFLLVGATLLGGDDKRTTTMFILGGMVVASCLNPRGWGAWGYVFSLLTDPSSQQLGTEWRPPTMDNWQGKLFFGWFLLFAPLAAYSPNRLKLTHWLWFILFGGMALSGLRYVIWFSTILAPLTAYLITPLVGKYTDRTTPKGIPILNYAILGLLLILPLPLLPGLRETWWAQAPPVLGDNTPVAATAWLAQHPEMPDRLFSHIAFSSYLIYALPQRLVWNDTRLELYPLEQSRRYLAISEAHSDWQELLEEERINLIMVDQISQPNLYLALQRAPQWHNNYQDKRVAIFVRK